MSYDQLRCILLIFVIAFDFVIMRVNVIIIVVYLRYTQLNN